MTSKSPVAVMLFCILLSGCGLWDSVDGGRDYDDVQFSEPTDDEPGDTLDFPGGEVDPTPTDPITPV